jgi:transcriptional regulator with PAS, ATPase and Fis domain
VAAEIEQFMISANQHHLIGTSKGIVELIQEIERVADSDAKVLITGESGVGKELVASALHKLSARAKNPLVAVNCAGLPETLLESELFGHVKGSFTGAYRDKPGKLEMANGSTVFLDEIGEMTLRMQGLLLRFMESGELQKVGADYAGARVDVRVVAATNRNLREMIGLGTFREDLYYRLNVIHFVVPPLRERRDDIPELVAHFLQKFTKRGRHVVKDIAPETLERLCAYSWPGNVRELEHVIERLVVTGRTELVPATSLPPEIGAGQPDTNSPVNEHRRMVAEDLYRRLLREGQSFWTSVYPLYMQRDLTRGNMRDLLRKGLRDARGNYRIVARLFNMDESEYKRFMNFLRKHDCHVPYREFR